MKQTLCVVVCLLAVGVTQSADECVRKEKEYYGAKYYNECHCSTFSYPEVVEAFEPLGIEAEPRWVACSEFDGGKWCVCGVSLSWKERPRDKEDCEAKKKEVKKLTEEFIATKKDFGVSAPLLCPH